MILVIKSKKLFNIVQCLTRTVAFRYCVAILEAGLEPLIAGLEPVPLAHTKSYFCETYFRSGRHCFMVLPAPSILWPRVQIPSTPSTLYSIYNVEIKTAPIKYWNEKIMKIKSREAGIGPHLIKQLLKVFSKYILKMLWKASNCEQIFLQVSLGLIFSRIGHFILVLDSHAICSPKNNCSCSHSNLKTFSCRLLFVAAFVVVVVVAHSIIL